MIDFNEAHFTKFIVFFLSSFTTFQGGPLRINAISLISYCFLVQLLFGATSGSETESRRLGAPKEKARDDDRIPPICDYDTDQISEIYDNVIDDLTSQGFSVKEGRYHAANANAAINNPGNPYMSYFFNDISGNQAINPVFDLEPGSAVVYVGCTPAASVYFSWQSYAFIHERTMVFASLGDATNHLVINTTQSGGVWAGTEDEDPRGKLTAVVTTADGTTFSKVSKAINDSGAPSGIINLDPIPSNRVDMERDDSLDFMLLVRPTIWTDLEEKKRYFSQLRRVILVDPPSEQLFDPIPEVPARKKGNGVYEAEMPNLSYDLAKLHKHVEAYMASENYQLKSNVTMRDITTYGFECLEEKTYCRGDSRDAQYLAYTQDEPFRKQDVYVVVGTNSEATGKVAYSNLGLYTNQDSRFVATALSVDNFIMEGSAKSFGIKNKKLIAYFFARKCSNLPKKWMRAYCFDVGYDAESEIPAKIGWGFGYRTYLDVTTKTAALLEELVIPAVLKFQL